MNGRLLWIFVTALVVAALASLLKTRGALSSQAQAPRPRYQTRCESRDTVSVDGYVSNQSSDAYQVSGQVRFDFISATSVSHPRLVVAANGLIHAGETALIAHARLPFQLKPGETCAFDVAGAIKKL